MFNWDLFLVLLISKVVYRLKVMLFLLNKLFLHCTQHFLVFILQINDNLIFQLKLSFNLIHLNSKLFIKRNNISLRLFSYGYAGLKLLLRQSIKSFFTLLRVKKCVYLILLTLFLRIFWNSFAHCCASYKWTWIRFILR